MDSDRLSIQPASTTWTNEKHLHFLNAMESSFVRTMLQSNARLDRYLPDSSESTLDLKTRRKKKHALSVDALGSKTKIDGKADKRTRRPSSQSQPCGNPSQDQVVPQLGNIGDEQDRSQ